MANKGKALRHLKINIRLILLIAFVYTQIQNLAKFLDRDSNTITVTSIEAEHNQEFQHPYYTICVLYYNTAYVDGQNASLRSTMIANWMSAPTLIYHELLNDISNKPYKYKTWLLTKGSKRNPNRLTLIPCFTYHFPNKVIPGTLGGTVSISFLQS